MEAETISLTVQQRAALEARDRSVSLAAGAGCGKTFVLTERFITELDPRAADDAAELDQIVAITFTDAAAREMRDRIRRRCFMRLQSAATDEEAASWQRLMRSIDAARISTIHSFCTALLRQHAVEAGLDPQFEVLDAAAADLLRLETIDDRLRALLIERNDDVLNYAALRGLDRLRGDLASFAGPREAVEIAKWRHQTPEQLVGCWIEYFEHQAAPQAAAELLGSPAFEQLSSLADPALAAKPKLQTHLTALSDTLAAAPASSLEALTHLRSLAMVQGVCTAKDWNDPDDHRRYADACKELRDAIDRSLLKKPLDPDASHQAAALGLALVRIAADVGASIEAAKRRRGQLEFDDLLVRAHALLLDPQHDVVRQQMGRRTRLMMVDEFQDTNPLQLEIIQAFCGEQWTERGLFAVGDFKQSIYRFNGAEPLVSTRLRQSVSPAGRLSLTRNFRSQPAILNFVNALFHDAFVEYEPLQPARGQLTPMPAVEFLWATESALAENDGDASSAATAPRRRKGAAREARAEEARWIARRLAQILATDDPIVVDKDNDQPRPVRPGDIAILLRSLSDAQAYEEALREVGLDYYLAGGHAFYSQQEIYDVLNLMRAVASVVDEIALAGALRSPLFAFADETLFWLVEYAGSLNAALASSELPPQLPQDEAAKVRRAAATLATLRQQKDRLLVAELLTLALDLTGYDATLLAEFLGPRKAANLEKLIEQARTIDHGSPGDLTGFITQLSEFVLQAPKEALAATEAEGGDVIRIMTIHHAKGLEFPFVVVADLERQRNLGGADPVLDPQLGPLVPLSERDVTVGYGLYRRRENAEDLEERKRLLYVATTRAADYLMLASSVADLDQPKSDWLQLLAEKFSLADGSLQTSLPVGYDPPQVRVTTERPLLAESPRGESRGADLNRLVVKTRYLAAKKPPPFPREALPIPVNLAAKRRYSFSRISGALAPAQPDVSEVGDDGELLQAASLEFEPRGADGRAFGALVHAVLERVDFRRSGEVRSLASHLAPHYVGPAHERAVDAAASLVERFLTTPLAAELAVAPIVRREIEFLLSWPPRQAAAAEAGAAYLQGFIDCLYQDASGRWRLIDYKTNQIAESGVSSIVKVYEPQMLAYRLACEQALGEPLAECTLVLLHPGVAHTLAWDVAAERRGIEAISAAIAAVSSTAAV